MTEKANHLTSRLFTHLLIVLLLLSSGCSLRSRGPGSSEREGIKISDVRGLRIAPRISPVEVSRAKLISALTAPGDPTKVRLVKIFNHTTEANKGIPEYRLFDITDNGPHRLLGLEIGDVLVAIEGWVLFDPQRFRTYVQLLQYANESELEIKRADEPVVLKLKIIPALEETSIPAGTFR